MWHSNNIYIKFATLTSSPKVKMEEKINNIEWLPIFIKKIEWLPILEKELL